jgi:formiminotetrahydrofolate cyclodeaminase
MELKQFLKALASEGPTPGGGSASALAATLSASLVAMVAGLSLKTDTRTKKKMVMIRKRALAIQGRLYLAITEDAESFEAVMDAIRLPKDGEKQRLHRSRIIQRAYRKASVVPKLVSGCSITLLEFCNILIAKGNPNARADAGVAAHLANAALEGGILNICVNVLAIRDRSFIERMKVFVHRLHKKRDRWMAEILKTLELV